MYTSNFDYIRATSVAEAVQLLKTKENAKLLAGGHSLIPAMKLRVAQPGTLIDIGRIGTLKGIADKGNNLEIGALATHAAVASSAAVKSGCAMLAEGAAGIGDQMVRNRGTIGGSLAHADPAADYPTMVMALGATLTVQGSGGTRQVNASDFFTSIFTTVLADDEILTSVSVPKDGKGRGSAYAKHPHPASGYAVAGAAAVVSISGGKVSSVSLVVGGCTDNPVKCSAAEAALVGKAATEGNIAAAAAKVADAIGEPNGDNYASGAFRINLAVTMAKRALASAAARAG
jgi:carbon-monoxide dehydrogenase medium subunit